MAKSKSNAASSDVDVPSEESVPGDAVAPIEAAAPRDNAVIALRVTAKADRFRRAGIEFGKEPITVSLDALTDEQVAALRAEPMLVVVDVTE